jgi:hypothetical protein
MVMNYDPISEVIDEPLAVSAESVQPLIALRDSEHFDSLPGTNTAEEKARLSQVLTDLLDRLINDLLSNPSKQWVMR